MTRILIVDDHAVVRAGVRAILEPHPGWEIVAEAQSGKEAITKAIETQPDVAIIDYSLPMINGIEVARQIHARIPQTEILIFTIHDSDVLVRQLLQAGVRGYVLKSDANQYLIAAVEALADHKPFFTGRVTQELIDALLKTEQHEAEPVLTTRERVIVQLVADGHSNRKMSEILNLSIKTIETHRRGAMRKLKLKSTAALIRYAIRSRLVE
jgi:DNA-binding NarL/FixJ family response regulator